MNRPGIPIRTRMRLPRFRAKNFSTCTRSPTARGSSHASHSPRDDVAFSSTERDRHLGIRPVSQLNTWPVVSPVNASRRPSRDAAHHSGSGRLAKPSPWGTCTSYSLTASWRTPFRVKSDGRVVANCFVQFYLWWETPSLSTQARVVAERGSPLPRSYRQALDQAIVCNNAGGVLKNAEHPLRKAPSEAASGRRNRNQHLRPQLRRPLCSERPCRERKNRQDFHRSAQMAAGTATVAGLCAGGWP